jgi:hypothetical protein
MPSDATFASFEKELNRLVESFGKRLAELKSSDYNEAKLRDDFLNPFFRALGWDMENKDGLIQREREVEIESATQIGGGRKRADYLFRTDKRDRFVCEAKKPAEELSARYAFQAKRYAWNKGVFVALLTDFEELKIYIVGGKPHLDEPHVGEWKSWHFRQYPIIARELWDLLARDQIAAGSIDQAIEALPKKSKASTGKTRQQWLIKPDRIRALDTDFLEFLDETRRDLASDIYKNNDHDELIEDNKLTEACQRIIDRILFLRICEDRDIDTGMTLQAIVETWRKNTGHEDTGRRAHQQPFDKLNDVPPANFGGDGIRAPKDSLWRAIVRHFRALDRRPPTHVPFFNGNLFKPHFTETLILSDEWLAGFIGELSDDETPYLFSEIPVEILGSVYERFLGNIVRPQGKGITVEPKPEVRKAGGVYYTPRYIVDYIVEQTAGKLLDAIAVGDDVRSLKPKPNPVGDEVTSLKPKTESQSLVTSTPTIKDFEKRTAALRLLDPACGSGSFLIRAFERVCEHWQKRLTHDLRACVGAEVTSLKSKTESQSLLTSSPTAKEWQKKHRPLCWVNPATGDVHLTVALKRQILTQNIYGVDLDSAAVEVTQLSLYLKMLENENRTTLQRQRELLADETEIALLPPLQDNIKCGNSLIASDFSMMPEDLVRVHAFDWPVQFQSIMRAGGFDAVIGNPPYIRIQTLQESDPESVNYLNEHYAAAAKGNYDIYVVFVERALSLLNPSGKLGYILPHKFFNAQYGEALREHLARGKHLNGIIHFGDQQIFDGATTYTCLLFLTKNVSPRFEITKVSDLEKWKADGSGATGTLEATDLNAAEWNFNIGKGGVLFEKLSKIPTTLDTVAARMGQGIRTSANEVFVLDLVAQNSRTITAHSEILGREVKLDRESVLLFLQGREIKPYSLLHSGKVVIMPYRLNESRAEFITEKEFKDEFPQTMEYLRENKAYLSAREKGRFRGSDWYCYGRVQNIDLMLLPKILVPDIAERASFALDEEGEFAFTSGYGITLKPEVKVSPKFVLGLLNSKLLDFFLKKVSTTMRGGFFRYFTQFIEKLPIVIPDLKKPTDKTRHDKLVVLVDKLLGLMPTLRAATADREKATLQNAVTATDQQIDALVYELYGLTEDEIKLVEGGQ